MPQFNQFVTILTQQAIDNNHRYLVVLAGDQSWAVNQLAEQLDPENTLWLGDGQWTSCQTMAKAKAALGREFDALVFNAYSGFNPDAFGQSVGALAGGGICFLIIPPFESWPEYDDPDYQRYLASVDQQGLTSANFIQRASALIQSDQSSYLIEQDKDIPTLTNGQSVCHRFGEEHFSQQQHAIEQIVKTATGHRNRPLVITADRGRGKSSALGLASATLLQSKLKNITVTAPNSAALDSLFKHAEQLLEGAILDKASLKWQGKSITFLPPDELVSERPACELLLIDEAAAIPTPMLTVLAKSYSRLVYATTVHGYEGTGRGFSLRFLKTLAGLYPQWRHVEMSQPIRWSINDPLESISNRMLGLHFNDVNVDSLLCDGIKDSVQFSYVSQSQLSQNEELLGQIFSLLVSAHYQTKPSDFRQLLDAPLLRIAMARCNGVVIATALILHEGEFEQDLAHRVWLGERRLRGHLLPQSLTAQVGLEQAACYRFSRVMRIAVHPNLQHLGIGSLLEDYLATSAQADGVDYIGASFGATEQLAKYWLQQGYHIVRLGLTKDQASGTHSVMVLKSLRQESEGQLLVQARDIYSRALRYSLSGEFNQLDQALVSVLVNNTIPREGLSLADIRNIKNYCDTQRPIEQVDFLIAHLVLQNPKRLRLLTELERDMVIAKLLQKQSWQQVVSLVELTGKKQAKTLLKQAVKTLLGGI